MAAGAPQRDPLGGNACVDPERGAPHGGHVKTDAGRTCVEGVPPLAWGTGRNNTFLGCLEGALSVTGRPFSFAELAVYSGMAFRVRWYLGDDGRSGCPSSSVGEFPEEASAVADATGWQLDGSFADSLAPRIPDIVRSIDAGFPALVYDRGWDVAVCQGYADGGLTLMLRSYGGASEEPADALPGYLLLVAGHLAEPMVGERLVGSLRRAVRLWCREPLRRTDPDGRYVYGPDGYAAWAAALRLRDTADEHTRGIIEHASGMNYVTLLDTRVCAASLLREHADALGHRGTVELGRAAETYERMLNTLSREHWQEPGRQPELLEEACSLEAEVVGCIRRALP